MATPNIALRLPADEKKELERLAADAGVTLADALRNGARLYLAALTMPRARKGVKLGAKSLQNVEGPQPRQGRAFD